MSPVFLAMMLIVVGAVVRAGGAPVTNKGLAEAQGIISAQGRVPLMQNIGRGR